MRGLVLRDAARPVLLLQAFPHGWLTLGRTDSSGAGYNHVATTITVVLGMAARLVAIPCAVLGMLGARKSEDNGPRLFFYCLLGLSVICFLDLFVCLFEVHAVCASVELHDWNGCAHEWGKNQHQCVAENATDSGAVGVCAQVEQQLAQNGGEEDEMLCTTIDGWRCQYIAVNETDWVTPECCEHSNWSADKGPCNRAPVERRAEFDTEHCEFISDVYDVGLGAIWTLLLFLMAWYVHSYRVDLATGDEGEKAAGAPEFTNPMNESDEEASED
jgi:hypothetical protein